MNILKQSIVLALLATTLFTGCSKNASNEPVDNSIATVSAFVGNPVSGPLDGTGALAYFNRPIGLSVDAAGVLYVTDSQNNKIRKVTPDGIVTSFSGNGTKNSTDGPKQTATFSAPYGIAVDPSGNCYVTDSVYVRKVAPDGSVTTLVKTGLVHPGNLALDGSGNVYVSDYGLNRILKFTPLGVMTIYVAGSGATITFPLRSPGGLTFDVSGNLYVCDSGDNVILKITPAGVVSTLAGAGVAGSANGTGNKASFNFPEGIAVDATGNVYVADKLNRLIRMITPAGVVTTLAGTGAAGSVNGYGDVATFFQPLQLAIDKQGVLYVTDTTDQVRKITIKK